MPNIVLLAWGYPDEHLPTNGNMISMQYTVLILYAISVCMTHANAPMHAHAQTNTHEHTRTQILACGHVPNSAGVGPMWALVMSVWGLNKFVSSLWDPRIAQWTFE